MRIEGIARYPIKGLIGEALSNVALKQGLGIPGDRRFAFANDASRDDGNWHSSRSFLINAVNDNLLKFSLHKDKNAWVFTSPSGEHRLLEFCDIDYLKEFNRSLAPFFGAVPNWGGTPKLVERSQTDGPKGYWDFPDTELLIVNLATVRDLEERWKLKIDPRRFRANLLIDGFPAWSEFGFYGSKFSVGDAKFEVLRPARRCAATSVNPDTGARDVEIQKLLAQKCGHGFFGVYARVSKSGDISVKDEIRRDKVNALRPIEMTCENAPDITLWPKLALVELSDDSSIFSFSPIGAMPLAPTNGRGRMRIHLKSKFTIVGEIIQAFAGKLTMTVENGNKELSLFNGDKEASSGLVLLSGPYGLRK